MVEAIDWAGNNGMSTIALFQYIQHLEAKLGGPLLHRERGNTHLTELGRIMRPSHRVTGNRRDSVDGAGWEYAHVAIDDCTRIRVLRVYDRLNQKSKI